MKAWFFIILTVIYLVSALFTLLTSAASTDADQQPSKLSPPLVFSMRAEPKSIDPINMPGSESIYIFNNIYRGLTRFVGGQEVIFDQAERCRYKSQTVFTCTLRKDARWSDGTPVLADDFVAQFRRLVSPESQCPMVNLLFGIKNAKDIYQGRNKTVSSLAVRATSSNEIEFDLIERDNEFLEKLSNPFFVPYKAAKNHDDKTTWLFNGPYAIKSWVKNQRIRLESNSYYPSAQGERPPVEVVFVAEDAAALALYEKGTINFLTRLSTINIPKYKDRPDFFRVAQARFDYIGFNMRPGHFFEKKENRQAFASSSRFDDFKKAFFAIGAPGCPSLGEPFLSEDLSHCQTFKADQKHLVSENPLKMAFSKMGGDDIRRQAEWFQGQWKANLGLGVELRDLEQRQYSELLKTNPPDLFRKGVMLNRPTCLAALETFKKDSHENHTGFSNLRFENLTEALYKNKMSASERASVCGVASDILFKEEYVGIPLGRFDFVLLVSTQYTGWHLNELNQLDLTHLKYSEAKK